MKELLKDIYRTFNPYFKYRVSCKIQDNVILYEAFAGRSMSCGPYALFQALLQDERFASYRHVWALDDLQDNKVITEQYKGCGNVTFVRIKSRQYYKYLAVAKYLINNSTFPEIFAKKEGQVYINTWHGIALKHMGYDMEDGAIGAANIVRGFLQADYLLSAGPFQSRMYLDAYKMEGIFQGEIIETGQARCDALFHSQRETVVDLLLRLGVQVERGKKLILYAPTWKGSDFARPDVDLEQYRQFKRRLEEGIDTTRFQVLIKPHQTVYKEVKRQRAEMPYMVPASIDTNTLLTAVDILISDYSSIYFDFLVTGRPILFYIPDLAVYQESRGLYMGVEQLPGPATDSPDTLAGMVRDIEAVSAAWRKRREEVRQECCPFEDGSASERLVNHIFRGEPLKRGNILRCENGKKKIVLFHGALRSTGITSSLMGLLQNMDYDRYDVTLYIYRPQNEEELQRMRAIPEEVRIMVHTKAVLGNLMDMAAFVLFYRPETTARIGAQQYARMFGSHTFDYVIDFVGYSPLFCAAAGSAPAGVKSIWQHNDMQAERGNKKHIGIFSVRGRMDRVFASYAKFDNIIACSRSVMEVNRRNLGKWYGAASCKYVQNPLQLERIRTGLSQEAGQVMDLVTGKTYSLQEDRYRFVSMGRLAPEKNQRQLILAMELMQRELGSESCPDLLLLGDGQLKEELMQLVRSCRLEGRVILCGNVENPFAIMKRCGCFILPSLHEGQPMVILEARTLGMDVIVSDFSTAKDILIEGGQLVAQTDAKSLSMAMRTAMRQGTGSYSFDGEAYNRQVMECFYQSIGKGQERAGDEISSDKAEI